MELESKQALHNMMQSEFKNIDPSNDPVALKMSAAMQNGAPIPKYPSVGEYRRFETELPYSENRQLIQRSKTNVADLAIQKEVRQRSRRFK